MRKKASKARSLRQYERGDLECKLSNQLQHDYNTVILLAFDGILKEPPYVDRPIFLWFDTPQGRIQAIVGLCDSESFIIGSKTYISLYNTKLDEQDYNYCGDFMDKLVGPINIYPDTKISTLLSEIGLSGIGIRVFENASKTTQIYPADVWCSIEGKHIPLDSDFFINHNPQVLQEPIRQLLREKRFEEARVPDWILYD